jgi:hypothetical protein
MKTTNYYWITKNEGMTLRNGKKINNFQSTELYRQFQKIQEIYYNRPHSPSWCWLEYCNSNCCLLDHFIKFCYTFNVEFSKQPKLDIIYNSCKIKINDFIRSLTDETGQNTFCQCKQYYIEELMHLKKIYDIQKYKRDLFFKLSSVMNKDVAAKILKI